MLLEMLSRVAADVMPLQAEEQVRSSSGLGVFGARVLGRGACSEHVGAVVVNGQ